MTQMAEVKKDMRDLESITCGRCNVRFQPPSADLGSTVFGISLLKRFFCFCHIHHDFVFQGGKNNCNIEEIEIYIKRRPQPGIVSQMLDMEKVDSMYMNKLKNHSTIKNTIFLRIKGTNSLLKYLMLPNIFYFSCCIRTW